MARAAGPKAVVASGMFSSKVGSSCILGKWPGVRGDPLTSPQPSHQMGQLLELGGGRLIQAEAGDLWSQSAADAEGEPSAGQRCMVVANAAVTAG